MNIKMNTFSRIEKTRKIVDKFERASLNFATCVCRRPMLWYDGGG